MTYYHSGTHIKTSRNVLAHTACIRNEINCEKSPCRLYSANLFCLLLFGRQQWEAHKRHMKGKHVSVRINMKSSTIGFCLTHPPTHAWACPTPPAAGPPPSTPDRAPVAKRQRERWIEETRPINAVEREAARGKRMEERRGGQNAEWLQSNWGSSWGSTQSFQTSIFVNCSTPSQNKSISAAVHLSIFVRALCFNTFITTNYRQCGFNTASLKRQLIVYCIALVFPVSLSPLVIALTQTHTCRCPAVAHGPLLGVERIDWVSISPLTSLQSALVLHSMACLISPLMAFIQLQSLFKLKSRN